MDYKSTLNLPKTDFAMQAGLPKREPVMLEKWYEDKVYETVLEKNDGKPLYVLHDGPPYANGDIHLGTALNKTLKDFIVRYKNMSGFKAPYVPGWDTHGLPTELKARKKAGVSNSTAISDIELRKLCREFALGYLDEQRNSFKRLGGIGEWDNPYVTLRKEFEAKQIEIFSEMATKGLIYKGLKPVYWCPECETALAEAEIEYAEDPCHSIYVKFRVTDDKGLLTPMGADLSKTYFVIWTTTTWTLPANVAICVGPEFEYALVKSGDEYYVMATALTESAMQAAGKTDYEILGTLKGSDLEYMKTAHPFIDRTSLVIVGDHVTLESGTGCVHTAPGHGVEDYDVCHNHYPEIPIVVPVDSHGKMTEEELNPVWQHLLNGEIDILVCTTLIETGIDVRNCNTLIIEDADRMGLAQLYQIRGRVGRSGRKAYAYFTFRRDKTLTDIAQKRLSAIREFTAFGSGFRIAMRDLQIRGAGSLLGHSQHGHMEAVGYDLYVKMLGQAIARAKGEPIQRDKSECLVDLRVDAFIPEKYIADGPGRIEAYKRIAAIQTPEDAADVLDELIDRYGDPPPSVSDLVNVSLVRVQATAVGVYEVTQKKDTLLLQVETLDVAMIRGLLIAFNGRVTAGAGTKPYLSVTLQPDEKPLELLQSILKAMADILAAPPEENTGKK